MNHCHRILSTLPLLAALACADDATMPTTDQTWVLRSVGGQDLPVIVEAEGHRFTILADTIRFFDNGDWNRSQHYLHRGPAGPEEAFRPQLEGFLTIEGNTIILDFECPDFASCIPPSRLTVHPQGLVIDLEFQPPAEDLLFQRG